jgi:hypothetical protein
MTHEIRNRILRQATAEEKERHRAIREEIQQELPELKQWARESAARHQDRVAARDRVDRPGDHLTEADGLDAHL